MKVYNILKVDKSGDRTVSTIVEAYLNYDKAVISIALLNKDAEQDQYYHITSVELDDTGELASRYECDGVFVSDEQDNMVAVDFGMTDDFEPINIGIGGFALDDMNINEDLKNEIRKDVQKACDWVAPSETEYDL